jgi:hypothetical protein
MAPKKNTTTAKKSATPIRKVSLSSSSSSSTRSSSNHDSDSSSSAPSAPPPKKSAAKQVTAKVTGTSQPSAKKQMVAPAAPVAHDDSDSSGGELNEARSTPQTKKQTIATKTHHVSTNPAPVQSDDPILVHQIINESLGTSLKIYEFPQNREEYSYFTEYTPEIMAASFAPGLNPGHLFSENIVFQHNKVFYIKVDSFHKMFQQESAFMQSFYKELAKFMTTSPKINKLLIPEIMVNTRKENPTSKFASIKADLITPRRDIDTHFVGIYYNTQHDVLNIVTGVISVFNENARKWLIYETMSSDDYNIANPINAVISFMHENFNNDKIAKTVFVTNDTWFDMQMEIKKFLSMTIMMHIALHVIPHLKAKVDFVVTRKEEILKNQEIASAIDEDIPDDYLQGGAPLPLTP